LFDTEEIFMDTMVLRPHLPLREVARSVARKAPGPIRLTRRGRYVVLSFLITVIALAVVLIARPGNADDPTRPQPVAVVHSGDTLWSIASSYAPHRDRRDTVEDIRRLNHLDGYTLRVGQQLKLPR
jgi:Tfp pilus assembly protein FimV